MDIKSFGDSHNNKNKIKNLLYHGSFKEISNPMLVGGKYTKDFGCGFYLTNSEQQAVKFTGKFEKSFAKRIVNVYEYTETDDLNIKLFPNSSEEWVDFIAKRRMNLTHNYDIVEGPMADDKIWNKLTDYINGILSKEEFIFLCRFRYPTHQLCLCTEKALKTITFLYSYEVPYGQ